MGGQFGVFRFLDPGNVGKGIQIGIEAGVFTQFDMRTPANDLITADFIAGVPITWRHDGSSARLWFVHRSAHAGDEYLLKSKAERFDLTIDGINFIFSQDISRFLRGYAGWDQVLRNKTTSIRKGVAQAGFDFTDPNEGIPLGRHLVARLRGGVDVRSIRDLDWDALVTTRVGFHLADPVFAGRSAGIYLEWLKGPSPAGQFYGYPVSSVGISAIFTL
jgi:hypothetical protein